MEEAGHVLPRVGSAGGMKAASASTEGHLELSALSALPEDVLGWQDDAGDLQHLAGACPHSSSSL